MRGFDSQVLECIAFFKESKLTGPAVLPAVCSLPAGAEGKVVRSPPMVSPPVPPARGRSCSWHADRPREEGGVSHNGHRETALPVGWSPIVPQGNPKWAWHKGKREERDVDSCGSGHMWGVRVVSCLARQHAPWCRSCPGLRSQIPTAHNS